MEIVTGVLLVAAGAIGGLGLALWWVSEELRELDEENEALNDELMQRDQEDEFETSRAGEGAKLLKLRERSDGNR